MGVIDWGDRKRPEPKKFNPNEPVHFKRSGLQKKSLVKLGEPAEVRAVETQEAETDRNEAVPQAHEAHVAKKKERSHIRLGVDLTPDRHRRLRIYAASNCTSMLAVIVGWIDEHCPE